MTHEELKRMWIRLIVKQVLVLILLLFAVFIALCRGDTIAAPGFASPNGWGGAWIGTFTGIPLGTSPTGTQTDSVAQLITSAASWQDLILQVQLADSYLGVIDFSFAPDNAGQPGPLMETESISLKGGSAVLTTYTLPFMSATLGIGTYWLIATSPTSEPYTDQVPMWAAAPCTDALDTSGNVVCNPVPGTIELSNSLYNDGAWQPILDNSMAFELDGVDPATTVPEPRERWAILGILLLWVAAYWSRPNRRER